MQYLHLVIFLVYHNNTWHIVKCQWLSWKIWYTLPCHWWGQHDRQINRKDYLTCLIKMIKRVWYNVAKVMRSSVLLNGEKTSYQYTSGEDSRPWVSDCKATLMKQVTNTIMSSHGLNTCRTMQSCSDFQTFCVTLEGHLGVH